MVPSTDALLHVDRSERRHDARIFCATRCRRLHLYPRLRTHSQRRQAKGTLSDACRRGESSEEMLHTKGMHVHAIEGRRGEHRAHLRDIKRRAQCGRKHARARARDGLREPLQLGPLAGVTHLFFFKEVARLARTHTVKTQSHTLTRSLSSSSTPSACSALFFIQDLNRARRRSPWRSPRGRRSPASRRARRCARSSRTAAGATSTSGIRAGPAPLPRALPEGARAVAPPRGLGCGL